MGMMGALLTMDGTIGTSWLAYDRGFEGSKTNIYTRMLVDVPNDLTPSTRVELSREVHWVHLL